MLLVFICTELTSNVGRGKMWHYKKSFRYCKKSDVLNWIEMVYSCCIEVCLKYIHRKKSSTLYYDTLKWLSVHLLYWSILYPFLNITSNKSGITFKLHLWLLIGQNNQLANFIFLHCYCIIIYLFMKTMEKVIRRVKKSRKDSSIITSFHD